MGNLSDFFKQGIASAQKGNDEAFQSASDAASKSALSKQQAQQESQAAQQKSDLANKNLQTLLGAKLPPGAGASIDGASVTRSINPMQQVGQQGQAFNKIAGAAYKPINDQLSASKSTLDALDQGNATSDKLALINEAKLSLSGSGGRAIGQMVSHLAGDPSMASDSQKALNWLQNTPNIPTMQPAQRDSIRESVFNRIPQLEQQHQQAAAQLGQLGPATAPYADTATIAGSYINPAEKNLGQLKQMQQEYMKGRQGQKNSISNPSTSSPNPTTLDKLKSFFTGGGTPAQPSAPAAAGGGAPMGYDDWVKAGKPKPGQ